MYSLRKVFHGKIVKIFFVAFIIGIITPTVRIMNAIGRENRTALVIGNGSYKISPLANPVNDANDMAMELENCGFTVIKRIDCSRKEIRNAIREFEARIRNGGVGLFYYAGHGIQINGENYLIPLKTNVKKEYEVEDDCVKVSNVMRAMEYAGNHLNIVILDACRNNPFEGSFRSTNMGLAKMDAPSGSFGSFIAYATAPGSVALDGTGRNGLYTSTLLKYMKKPDLKVEDVFKKVRVDVMQATGGEQVPWEASSLTGEFYFRLTSLNTTSVPRPPPPVDAQFYVDPNSNSIRFVAFNNRFSKDADDSIYDGLLKRRWLIVGDKEIFNWDQANKHCRDFFDNYRLPTRSELQSLITKKKNTGAWGRIAANFFPLNTRSKKYWTGTKAPFGAVWYVDFSRGTWSATSKSNHFALLLISD